MNTLYAFLGWIAVALIICAGFLYLMVPTPVDRDEDDESDDYN